MTFNGPPKPAQEKPPEIETPEYWKENLPFKSPQKLYELEFEFAKLMSGRLGVPLAEAVDQYAPAVRNHIFTFDEDGDWHVTGLEEGVTDENILEHAWARSLERHAERNSKPTPYHEERRGMSRFGCHYYNVKENDPSTIRVHFFNAEFEEEWVDGKDVSTGPLAEQKMERRKHELTDMFRDIKTKHPEAKYVEGRSSLYSMKPKKGEDRAAYLRLYPPTYLVGDIDYDPELWGQGTTVWGQFLGGNEKKPGEYGFKEKLVGPFMEKAREVPIERLADALPNPPRNAKGNIEDFYKFYGIT